MIHINNIKVRTKVVLIVCLASIIVFFLAELITLKYEFKRYQTQISELTISSAQLISDYCGLLLYNKTPENIKIGLSDFSRIPFVYDAFAIDSSGKVLSEYHKSKDTIIHKIKIFSKNNYYQKGFIHVNIPINYENKNYGNIYVRSYMNTELLISGFIKWTIIILCIQSIFAFLIIYLIHRSISNPIQYLTSVTRKIIENKNYKIRIEKRSFDEIGELYDEFNNLLYTIDTYGQKKNIVESELNESNERYKTLVDNIPGIVFRLLYEKEWKIEVIGEGIYDLSDGYTLDYFIEKGILGLTQLLSPDQQELFSERLQSSIGINREFESVYKVVTRTNRNKWILMKGRFVFNHDTQLTSVDGILFDQTEKINAQELLKKTEKRYHDLFDNLNDAAFLIEMDSDLIVETNKEGEKLLGLKSEDIVYKLKKSTLCKFSNTILQTTTDNKEEEESNLYDFYAEITKNSQINIPVHVRSSVLTIGDKKHMLCLVRDISDRIEYEENLKKAKEKAEESDRLKSMFLSNMSHEIRTPLNGFIGFSKLILESKSKEETESYVSIIDGCGKQLLRIIDDILDVSRIETGQMTFYNEEFSLNSLLDEVSKIIEEQLKRNNKKNISFKLDKGLYDGNDLLNIDRHRLYQVLINIASNAVKFTNEGTIKISYKPLSNGMIEFRIIDTGIGIEADKKELIFNRFAQANNSIAVQYGGSGLGLAISKGIIDLMGGTIGVESEFGKGSIFIFSIKRQ